MKKILVAVAVGLVLVASAAAYLVRHEFDSPVLGQALLDQLGAATGVAIKARTFRLRLLDGLVLEDVQASSSNADRQLTLAVDRLVFEHRLAPLLAGRIAVDKVLIERPRIEVVERVAPPPRARAGESRPGSARTGPARRREPPPPVASLVAGAAPADDRRVSLELAELIVQDADVAFRRTGESRGATFSGVTLSMRNVVVDPSGRSLASLAGQGDLRLASGSLDTLTFTDARARFGLAESRFEIPELSFVSEYGRLTGTTLVDFTATPFTYRLKASGEGVDVNRMLGSPGGLGAASVNVTAEGAGALSKDLRAEGTVTLAPGTLPAIPAMRGIDRALSKTVLVEWPYKATPVRFTLDDDTVTLAPFRIESELARVEVTGAAALAGTLDLAVSLATPLDGVRVDGLNSRALASLADSTGWASIPLRISGTLDEPRIRPDAGRLTDQARQGLTREARGVDAHPDGRAQTGGVDAVRRPPAGRPR
jgi:hypothetical protein